MRFLLKPVWFVLFLVLVAANLIMSIGMKIGERALGFFITDRLVAEMNQQKKEDDDEGK